MHNAAAILATATLALTAGGASATCWQEAARPFAIDPLLIKAIAWAESRGNPYAEGPKLSDGNQALGLMQVNTIHMPELAKQGIRRSDLYKPCISQKIGARILASCITRYGRRWRAVGCYNTGPASKNVRAQRDYVVKVRRYYARLQAYESGRSTAAASRHEARSVSQ